MKFEYKYAIIQFKNLLLLFFHFILIKMNIVSSNCNKLGNNTGEEIEYLKKWSFFKNLDFIDIGANEGQWTRNFIQNRTSKIQIKKILLVDAIPDFIKVWNRDYLADNVYIHEEFVSDTDNTTEKIAYVGGGGRRYLVGPENLDR